MAGESGGARKAPRRDFTARYLVETYEPVEKAAEIIAGEQSCGTFITVPGETEELKERARARVIGIEPLPEVAEPSLPNAFARRKKATGPYRRGVVEVSFPIDNVGPNLPNLDATVAGNLFELGELTGLRVLDIDLPEDYAASFPGPGFGASGRVRSPRCTAARWSAPSSSRASACRPRTPRRWSTRCAKRTSISSRTTS